ncbi:cytochrome P450 [Leifsonia sp. NPDC014704]|uniref:cytochrome P450 n=1 Tax=Leifsonia sp. NPDC014704 TaxID=3364123 RepID=UPI0036F4523B
MGDSTLRFLRDGYLFGTRGFRSAGRDHFRTRLLGRPVLVMRGADAARFFYEGGRFSREGAMPRSVLKLLQDEGSVQSLEGEAHRRRKELFLGLLMGPSGDALVERFREELLRAVSQAGGGEVVLLDLFHDVLTRAVTGWAGLPDAVLADLRSSGVLAQMVDAAGTVGPENWAVRARRSRAERLLADAVRNERATPTAPEGSPFAVIAAYTELTSGAEAAHPLPPEVAAVELLNLLRPVVAVGRYLTFAALALHRHPGWRADLAGGDDAGVRWFAQEVRRFYPFFPVIGGRATRDLDWKDEHVRTGDWVLLDLYGTTHDPAIWDQPNRFLPQRFDGLVVEPNTLIPQGGGGYHDDHRCPGEPVTVDLVDAGIRMLARELDWAVPEQDLRISLRTFPARPRSGLVVTGLRASEPAAV